MRIIAIDYGEKRIGVAVGDTRTRVAVPLKVIEVRRDAAAAVARVLREESAAEALVGLPVSLNGTHGPQVAQVEAFIKELSALSNIPIRPWDERLTTVEAESRLRGAPKGTRVDALAAAIILQAYLDTLPEAPGG